MDIIKKIVGVILLLIAALLTLATLFTSPQSLGNSNSRINDQGTTGIAHLVGSLFGLAILITIIYFLIRFGLKLIRKKNVMVNTIDEIGSDI